MGIGAARGAGRDVGDDLRSDCGRCLGLCCVVLPFARSRDFPVTKAAGVDCRHLAADHRCTIHAELRERGWVGCTVFECFGAGQRLSRQLEAASQGEPAVGPGVGPGGGSDDESGAVPGGESDAEPGGGLDGGLDLAAGSLDLGSLSVQADFAALRHVQEIRYYLWAAIQARRSWGLDAPLPRALAARVDALAAAARDLADGLPDARGPAVVAALHERAAAVLAQVSAHVRPAPPRGGLPTATARRLRPRADLAGADLRGLALTGTDLRGALLLGADLRGADLGLVDVLGADLRGARVAGADLRHALYLTQSQVNATDGDAATRLPAHLTRPAHWDGGRAARP